LPGRAARDDVAPKREAELLTAAAMIEWRAAYDVTQTYEVPGRRLPRYRKPPAEEVAALHAHLGAARELVDRALALGPRYDALLYRKLILEGVVSLAQIENDTAGLAAAKRDASEASQAYNQSVTGEDHEAEGSWLAESERAATDAVE